MSSSFDGGHLADLLIEQFGDGAAAEAVSRVRDCQASQNAAEADKWLAILDAVFARQQAAADLAARTEEPDDLPES